MSAISSRSPGRPPRNVAKVVEDVARAIEEVLGAVKKLEKVEEPANVDEISSPVHRGWLRDPGDW